MEEDIFDQIASGKAPTVATELAPAPVPQAQVASREAQVAVNLDTHLLGVLHEGLLDEQAAFLG